MNFNDEFPCNIDVMLCFAGGNWPNFFFCVKQNVGVKSKDFHYARVTVIVKYLALEYPALMVKECDAKITKLSSNSQENCLVSN